MVRETRLRRNALLATAGGAVLLPYALTKGALARRVVETDTQLLWLSTDWTAQVVHLFETIPVLMLAMGLGAVAARYDVAEGSLSWAGILVALTGFGSNVVFHWGEHLLTDPTLPATSMGLFDAGYAFSWVLINLGLFVCGAAVIRRRGPSLVPAIFVAALPVALTLSLLAVALDAYTFAGTNRVVASVTWILVGGQLWASTRRPSTDRDEVDGRRVDAP